MTANRRSNRLIDQIIAAFGSGHAMAKKLAVAPQTVYRWRDKGWVPEKYAAAISYFHSRFDIEAMREDAKRRETAYETAKRLRGDRR